MVHDGVYDVRLECKDIYDNAVNHTTISDVHVIHDFVTEPIRPNWAYTTTGNSGELIELLDQVTDV